MIIPKVAGLMSRITIMAQPTAEDALRLVDAFRAIHDEAEWIKVIELAEALAKVSRPGPIFPFED
jgi:hypothetical protein